MCNTPTARHPSSGSDRLIPRHRDGDGALRRPLLPRHGFFYGALLGSAIAGTSRTFLLIITAVGSMEGQAAQHTNRAHERRTEAE